MNIKLMLRLPHNYLNCITFIGCNVGGKNPLTEILTALMNSFPNLELVCCSMSGSKCCFLTCIQISQNVGKVVWYSHLFKYFPQFVVIHTVKGFSVVNEAEVLYSFS